MREPLRTNAIVGAGLVPALVSRPKIRTAPSSGKNSRGHFTDDIRRQIFREADLRGKDTVTTELLIHSIITH